MIDIGRLSFPDLGTAFQILNRYDRFGLAFQESSSVFRSTFWLRVYSSLSACVLSLNDTRLFFSNAKFIFKNEHSQHHFRSYWTCSTSSRLHDGVGILLCNPLHKHVQTIDSWNGRLLKLDLFFHQTKISIISLYYPPSGSTHQSICNDLIAKLLSWLDHARANNYFVVILGNFNVDETLTPTIHPGLDPTFYYANGSSRLDYIWSSPGFPTPVEQWNNFTAEVDDSLRVYLNRQYNSRLEFSSLSLDRMWHALKAAILNRFLYRLTTRRSNRPTQISQMTTALPSHLENLASLLPDYSVPTYSTTPVSEFKSFLRSQKNLISAFLSTKFAQHLTDSVEYYTALRDEHFSNSLGTFIDSALSVENCSIVFDRVLVVLDSTPTLLMDPSDIKQAAITHFQSIVSPPLV
ncbi:hypothetical protein RhiirB3_444829 [Rhizophagus irregularis]|nr:hypothetical protein RhiirB3_444829 [Rhizophagus irregularis]